MSFTFTNYAGIKPQQSPLHDLIGNLLSGYTDTTKAQFLRPNLQEALTKSKLENKYYGPNIESQIGLRGEQARHLGAMTQGLNISNPFLKHKLEQEEAQRQFGIDNPLLAKSGAAGQIGALMLLQQHPELMQAMQQGQMQESPQQNPMPNQQMQDQGQSYMPSLMQQQQQQQGMGAPNPMELLQQSILKSLQPHGKQYAPSNIGKLNQELRDIEAGYYPNSDRTLPIESSQLKEELAAPYRERLGSLKQGEHYIYDPESHEKIGVEKPFTPKEREQETGRAFFNEVFPDINNAFKDFIGKDSIKNFVKYADQYGKNDIATRKIDDLLLGQKLISAGVVNEAATLGAGKTNQTYRNLAKSFPGSDIPNLIDRYGKEFKLPTEAFLKAGVRFQNKINQASEKASTSIPATKKLYYNPEKHMKAKEAKEEAHEESKSAKAPKSEKASAKRREPYTDKEIRATAEKYHISEDEVKKRLKEASKND